MTIRLAAAALCAAFSLGLCGSSAFAQDMPSDAMAAAAKPGDNADSSLAALVDADRVIVPVWPKTATKLPETQEPAPVSFLLGEIEGIDPELLRGVTGNGFARKVDVEERQIGQVLMLSVAKGSKEETISAEGLTAQFDAFEMSELFPERNITVEGSKKALIDALKRLAEEDDKTEKSEKTTTEKNASESSGVGGAKRSNDMAASYQNPSAATVKTNQKNPTITVSSSREGCSIRVDFAQGKAIIQSREQTFSDGSLTSETACSDSEVSYPLKQSWLSCPDKVDQASMIAWPQYSLYYINDQGETQKVSECAPDDENPLKIVEDESRCSINLDFEAALAIPQSVLAYKSRSGESVEVRGCAPSTLTAAAPMTESTASCSLRHDFAAGKSYEMSAWTYLLKGVNYQAAPCADNGTGYGHETVYTDASGDYICSPIVNQAAGTVTLQSRKRITVNGVGQYINECTPDTTTQALKSTTDGCMNPALWTHDIGSGVSYGQERFYYLKGAAPVYIGSCQTSARTYVHDQKVTGWEYHDDQLAAWPLTTVAIAVNSAKYTLATNEIMPGAVLNVYVKEATVDTPTGLSTYEGCNAYRKTTRMEQWKRPDNTIYEKAIGAGTPQGPVNVCTTGIIDSRSVESGAYCTLLSISGGDGADIFNYSVGRYRATVNKTESKNTETGEIISTACAFSGFWNATALMTGTTWETTCASLGHGNVGQTKSVQTLSVPPCPF